MIFEVSSFGILDSSKILQVLEENREVF